MVTTVTKFIAADGTEFATMDEALAHDGERDRKLLSEYNHYTKTSYSGRRLLEKHSLSETGIWEVLGEDPNCDMGGYHHQPHLGYFDGTLEDVIWKAISLPGFWQWGGGGTIRKNNPPTVTKLS